jgi:hypothetical protein
MRDILPANEAKPKSSRKGRRRGSSSPHGQSETDRQTVATAATTEREEESDRMTASHNEKRKEKNKRDKRHNID